VSLHFSIHCRFVAHSYSGVRLTEDRREELDWPPSPGRLHQALMAAALNGFPVDSAEMKAAIAAFRWLEQQAPPAIHASKLIEGARTRPRIAIPQNNPKGADWASKSTLLAPTLRATPATGYDLEVHYCWLASDDREAHLHIAVLTDAAARMTYLGRAEDRVEAVGMVGGNAPASDLLFWQAQPASPVRLWIAKEGTTDALENRYRAPVSPRERKAPAQRWMTAQPYAQDCPQARQPVHVSIFQVAPVTDDPDATTLSCDPEFAGLWREAMRERVVQIAGEADHWNEADLANELLTGHAGRDGKPTQQPHLAIVPLPSFNASGTADGRVRRVALIGYAKPDISVAATEIYETLAAALDGEGVSKLKGRLSREDSSWDKIWSQLIGVSRVWYSITPIAIARGFKVPRFSPDGRALESNERHMRKLAELAALVRSSMTHMDMPEELIRSASIELTPSPLLNRTGRAERYRPPGETALLTHARIEFPEPIRGPLLLGDCRYKGLGLFIPTEQA
jgi:CRISPR-associated protein Csb2